MVFGAFANFAQNEWGNTVIITCQFLIALTFLIDAVISLMKRIKNAEVKVFNLILLSVVVVVVICGLTILIPGIDSEGIGVTYILSALLLAILLFADSFVVLNRAKRNKGYTSGVYENVFLFFCFFAFGSKNMHMIGAGPMLTMGVVFLAPFYIIKTVSFLKKNYSDGRSLVTLLSIGCLTTVLLGISLLFKVMHWPGATIFFYIAMGFTLIMIIGTLKWKYRFQDKYINVFQGFKLLKSHIVLLYYSLFIFGCYAYLVNMGLAPRFYSQRYPAAVEKLSDGTAEGERRSSDLIYTYDTFLERSAENGFLK